MRSSPRTALVFVVLVSLGAVGGSGPAAAQPTATGIPQADDPTPTNETTRHADPRSVRANGDLGALRAWLGGRMAARLEECVVEVGRGETNVCELRDDYPAWTAQYVEVAGDTPGDDDDRRGATLNETRRAHRSYASAVASYRATYDEYRQARDAGDDERARRLARELREQANAVHHSSDEIVAQYGVIEAEGDVELATATDSVNTTVENVSETTDAVEEAEFVNTTLAVDLDPRRISVLAPGTASGRLTTVDDEAVANRTIRLRFPDTVVRTRTDADGRFAVTYRPVTVNASTDDLTVRFVPRSESIYRGTTASTPVTITPVEPTVSVAVDPARSQFDETVRITGAVTAETVAIADVPVVVTMGDTRLDRVRTDDDGRFSIATTVPAIAGPGAVAVRADLALENQAVAATTGSTTLTVAETPTSLSIDAAAAGPSRVGVEGVLETADGIPVGNQPVTLRVNGTAVTTVRTDDDGGFATNATVPASLRDDAAETTVAIAAAFDSSGTNLDRSRATRTVTLPAATEPPGPVARLLAALRSALGDPLALGGVALVVLAALVALGRRRERWWPGSGAEPDAGPDDSGTPAASAADQGPASPLDRARERLGSDDDGAVRLAYATVRDALAEAGGPRRRADTHWEFLAACRQDGLSEEALAELTALTEAYENAAYAPVIVSRSEAEAAVRTAETLV